MRSVRNDFSSLEQHVILHSVEKVTVEKFNEASKAVSGLFVD
jgi:hypothetical protein